MSAMALAAVLSESSETVTLELTPLMAVGIATGTSAMAEVEFTDAGFVATACVTTATLGAASKRTVAGFEEDAAAAGAAAA